MRKFHVLLGLGGSVFISCVCGQAGAATASFGINFAGGNNGVTNPVTMASTDSAGVVPQTNWNNELTASGTAVTGLVDNSGSATALSTVSLTYTAGGIYTVGQAAPVGGDQELNDGFIYGNATVNITGIPYAVYNVYVYNLNDASGRVDQTWINNNTATSFFGQAASPKDANHVSGTANTYLYTQSVDTTGSGTPNGDYVLFSNVTGGSLQVNDTAIGNGYLNGIQIVSAPEPASAGLLGIASLGLLARRRRA